MPIPFRFAPIPLELLYDVDVHAEAVRLWAVIYRLADRATVAGGDLAVNRDVIAGKLGWTDKTLSKWTKVLTERGSLDVVRRGQGRPNLYRPTCPAPPDPEVTDRCQLEDPAPTQPSSLLEISTTEKEIPMATGVAAIEADFDRFWDRYPKSRRRERANCLIAYRKAAKTPAVAAVPTSILDGLERWLRYWADAQTEERFITTSIVWLRNRRWEDDPTLSTPKNGGRPMLRNAPGSALARGATDRTGESGEW